MKLKTLYALLLHHHGIARALRNSGFAAGQEEFEGAKSYANWHFTASTGSFIGKPSPLPDKVNGG